ncbi:hypothetical protein KCP71_11865 [Salmonella enterica subsp. enterica]|nr:hypothetical protein KCP71_11865 [Salmonella enterica subsp. enterica]
MPSTPRRSQRRRFEIVDETITALPGFIRWATPSLTECNTCPGLGGIDDQNEFGPSTTPANSPCWRQPLRASLQQEDSRTLAG